MDVLLMSDNEKDLQDMLDITMKYQKNTILYLEKRKSK